MKARIVRIGNSKGIRLPKPLLEQAGLEEVVELSIREGEIVISSAPRPREGWEDAARTLATLRGDTLLDDPTPTRFDEEEWAW